MRKYVMLFASGLGANFLYLAFLIGIIASSKKSTYNSWKLYKIGTFAWGAIDVIGGIIYPIYTGYGITETSISSVVVFVFLAIIGFFRLRNIINNR